MKSALTIAGILLLANALFSGVGQAQKTSAGYDQNANFSNYKTFVFDKGVARNPFVKAIIVAAVERELTSRGLTKVAADADLLVVYLAASGVDLQVASVPFYTIVNPAYSGMVGGSTSTMWDVTTGTLVIDLFDQKAERTVFRGTAKDVLQRAPSADPAADAQLVSKQINKGVAKIFKKYPVQRK
jgi:Domain of unknown function (DUF4136)